MRGNCKSAPYIRLTTSIIHVTIDTHLAPAPQVTLVPTWPLHTKPFHHHHQSPAGTQWTLTTPLAHHHHINISSTRQCASPPQRHIIHKTIDRLNVDFKKYMPVPDVAFYLHSLKFTYIPFIFNNPTSVPTSV
jgi:hypothetical protein